MPSSASSPGPSTITRTALGNYKADPNMLCASFNQDATCISVGSRRGYSIVNCDPFGRVYSRAEGATSVVEMLFCTSLVALVGAGDKPAASPRRLQIVNTKRQSTICELQFPTSVLAVRLNRRRLVVILEEQIYVYDISNMKLLHTIETSPNPNAICSLAPSSDNSYLAYPSPSPTPGSPYSQGLPGTTTGPSATSAVAGDVVLFDALTLSVTNIIQAHKAPLACLSLNSTGTLLATASEKGTVIRVFSVPNGDKVAQFRRGTYGARIFSIAFNPVSSLLCVSSDTETVHVFKLLRDGEHAQAGRKSAGRPRIDNRRESHRSSYEDDQDDDPGRLSRYSEHGTSLSDADRQRPRGMSDTLRKRSLTFGRNLAGSLGGFLPGSVTELWEPQRDFAFLKLPTSGVKSVVAISGTSPQIMVVTSEGILYCFSIDLESGGECILQKSYSLLDFDDAASSSIVQD